MPRNLYLAVIALLLLVKTQAQQNTISLTFQMSLPLGNYKNNYPKTGTGLLCGFLHNFETEPLAVSIGAEAGLLQVNAISNRYTGVFRNVLHEYVVSASNYIFTIAPKLRVDIFSIGKTGKFFIDESIGTNIFFTYTGISHDEGYNALTEQANVHYDSSASSSYWALRAAAGAGFEMGLGKKTRTKVMLKCSYVYGSDAKYYSHPSIDQLQITLVPKESATCMILAEFGFRFALGKKDKN